MQHTVEQLVAKARELHARGDLAGAIRQFEAALGAAGHHPAIAFELISAQFAAGRSKDALRVAREVVRRYLGNAGARMLLAQVLSQTGEVRGAIAELDNARMLDPGMVDAPALQGTLYAVIGDHPRSEAAFRAALALAPGHPGLLANLGHALKAQAKFAEACAPYEQALAAEFQPAALCAYADVLSRVGRTTDGIVLVEGALKQHADDADLHHTLGNLYQDEGRIEEAGAEQAKALELRPDFGDAAYNLGMIEIEQRRWDRAAEALARALALDPQSEDSHRAYAQALASQDDIEGALRAVLEAARITGNDSFTLTSAQLLRDLGRFDESTAAFDAVIKSREAMRDKRYWKARLYACQVQLARGDLLAGWRNYVHREDRASRGRRDVRFVDDPEIFFRDAGGARPKIFVDHEQGIGDQLFFLRFAEAAAAHCSSLTFGVDAKLRPLLRRNGFPHTVIDRLEDASDCSAQLWLSDLVFAAPQAYPRSIRLDPDPRLQEALRAELARCGPPPYIGVTWRAGLKAQEEKDNVVRYVKEIEPAVLGGLLRKCGGTIVVLQRGLVPGEDESFTQALGRDAYDFAGLAEDLERMLALLSLLDDYVTVSNTNVHLLAALASPKARLLVPLPAEWRWMAAGAESPWFPGLPIYREDAAEQWTPALARLEADLRQSFGSAGSPAVSPRWRTVIAGRRYTAEDPSARFRELLELYRALPGEAENGALAFQEARIKGFLSRTGSRTVLAYGSGQSGQYASAKDSWNAESIALHDPASADRLPEGSFDAVICVDTLDRWPEEDLEWMVGQLFGKARRAVFASLASYPAGKTLPDGWDARVTQRDLPFWNELFTRISRGYPNVAWELHVAQRDSSGGITHRRLAGPVAAVAETQQRPVIGA